MKVDIGECPMGEGKRLMTDEEDKGRDKGRRALTWLTGKRVTPANWERGPLSSECSAFI